MKKILTMVLIITVVIANAGKSFSPVKPPIFGIKIDFSSKAYWNGTFCAPREKGCCLHLEAGPVPEPGHIIGELSNSDQNGLIFTVSKRNGLSDDLFNQLFRQGKFLLDGDATFQQDIVKSAAGELDDPHQLVIDAQKANVSLQLALSVRNKAIDAYNDIIKMQV